MYNTFLYSFGEPSEVSFSSGARRQCGCSNIVIKWWYIKLTVKFGVCGQIGGKGYSARYLVAKLINPKVVMGILRVAAQPFGRGAMCGIAVLRKHTIKKKKCRRRKVLWRDENRELKVWKREMNRKLNLAESTQNALTHWSNQKE